MDKQRLEEITEQFCDGYCRYARECTDRDELDAVCDSCPIARLVGEMDA